MPLHKVNEAYETFRNTHSSRNKAEEEKNKYASGSAQRALLERQARIFDDLERAQFEYLELTLDEFWNDMEEIYDRWEGAGERRSPLREIEEGGEDDEGGERGQVSIRYRKMIIECEECGIIAHTPIKALPFGYGIIPICPKCKKEAKAIGAIEAHSLLFNDDGRMNDEFAILSQANRWIENCENGDWRDYALERPGKRALLRRLKAAEAE